MPENPESTLPTTGDHASKVDECEAPPTSMALALSIRSILGLALVSILNIGCVAFIVFHLSTHMDEPVQAEQIELRPGNISLEPAPAYLLAIPSQIERSSPRIAKLSEKDMRGSVPVPSTQAPPSKTPLSELDTRRQNVSNETAGYWVQLGALSSIETARSYWAKLQKNHIGLLESYQPKFIGPDQVGGSLYHLRVGPLPTGPAADLCQDLRQAGTECFCVAAEDKETEHELPTPANSWPEPS